MKSMRHENLAGLENRDIRQLGRKLSIPCAVEWGDTIIRGQIANLSFGGALITKVDMVPPEGASLIFRFQVEKEKVELEGRLVSKIAHTIREVMEGGEIISLGVKFEERREDITSKLIPVFRCLINQRMHRTEANRNG